MLIKRIVTALVVVAALGASISQAKTAVQNSNTQVVTTSGADDFGVSKR